MRHIKPVNEFFDFLKRDKNKYYKDLAKELNIGYKELGERALMFDCKFSTSISDPPNDLG